MTGERLIVTVLGLGLIVFIAWFFWLGKRKGVAAAVSDLRTQDALIVVKGGYTPDVVVVQRGRPVRLSFRREETATCSKMVLLPDFDRSAKLPTGRTVAVEFTPGKPGEYEFACQMGMFRGRLIVE